VLVFSPDRLFVHVWSDTFIIGQGKQLFREDLFHAVGFGLPIFFTANLLPRSRGSLPGRS